MDAKLLENKVIIVFGGNGDIGGAIAHGALSQGAIVIPTGRGKARTKKIVSELHKKGNPYNSSWTCDIRKRSEIKVLLRNVLKEFQRVDGMVCASGVYLNCPAQKMTESQWKTILDTNLTGTLNVSQIIGDEMLKQKKGSIVTIGSLASFVALTGTSAYAVSKAGVVALTKSLATEWAPQNVRVNCVVPGVFPTRLNKKALSMKGRVENILKGIPMKRLGKIEELSGAVNYLLSDKSKYVTGISLPVDGGFLSFSGY